ncbi:hypothetical protein R50073_19490 [Maricurvus nonylphenolicus]|uniref:arabinose operon transcriptional regulator AraC n=1 Tax=Maricurvus nonylphenolicus TaxID=1008307 RepID=UPI0036F38662
MDNGALAPSGYVELLLAIVAGKETSESDRLALATFLAGDYPGNIAHRAAAYLGDRALIESMLIQAPELRELLASYQRRIEQQGAVSDAEAITFFVEFSNYFDLVDDFSQGRVIVGVTRVKKDSPSDMTIRRSPGSVKGWAMELTVSGHGDYHCLRQDFISSPGDIVLLSPDAFYEHKRHADCEQWDHYWSYFFPDHRLTEWMQWPEVGSGIYKLHLGEQPLAIIKSLFESGFDESLRPRRYLEPLLLNYVENILIRCCDQLSQQEEVAVDSRVAAAMQFMVEHLHQASTIDEIASVAGLSKTQLSILFKKHCGCSVMAWREERRMAHASQLLAQTNEQVQEVALKVGYEDPLYFSRVFSRLVGYSPRQYRKLLKQEK